MSRLLWIAPRARREIDEAFEWYRVRSVQAATEFLEELDSALARIVDAPEQQHLLSGTLRRALLTRFPYGIYFRVHNDRISVVGVIHGRRHPRRWMVREGVSAVV